MTSDGLTPEREAKIRLAANAGETSYDDDDVRDLLAEIDRLRSELEFQATAHRSMRDQYLMQSEESSALRADNERLRRELANSMPLQYPLIRDWREASSGAATRATAEERPVPDFPANDIEDIESGTGVC